jgi:hypothetical protein
MFPDFSRVKYRFDWFLSYGGVRLTFRNQIAIDTPQPYKIINYTTENRGGQLVLPWRCAVSTKPVSF